MKFFDLELGGLGSSPMRVVTHDKPTASGSCNQVNYSSGNNFATCNDPLYDGVNNAHVKYTVSGGVCEGKLKDKVYKVK